MFYALLNFFFSASSIDCLSFLLQPTYKMTNAVKITLIATTVKVLVHP